MSQVNKAVRPLLSFGAVASREKTIADMLPYLRHVDEQTIRTKDGMLMSFVKFDGFCFQTADQADINHKLEGRNTFIRALNDSRFAVYSHIIRRQIQPTIGGDFSNPFCHRLDERYAASIRDQRMFVNDLYLTVIRKGFQGKVGMADKVMKGFRKAAGVSAAELDKEARKELAEAVSNLKQQFAPYGARVLSLVARNGSVYSEPCEFLAQLLNGGFEIPMLLPRMGLDTYLPTRRITFGKRALEIRGPVTGENRYGGMVSIREYPTYTGPGMLDGLLRIKGEFIVSQSFAIQDRAPVLSQIGKVQRQIAASDEGGTEVEEIISVARDELVSGRAVFGEHHLTVMCLGNTLADMERCVQDTTNELQTLGMTVVREDMNAEPCFWAQMPGNFPYIARQALITSRNFTAFTSLHNFALGRRDGNHWGPAISLLQTTSSTPYYFNFHRRQVGNFTVVGPTGSGKTVALSFLMAQAMRVQPQPRCAYFDKDRGAEIFIRAMGGSYEVLEPGIPTGFNPLQQADTPSNREFVKNLLRFMVRPADNRDLSAEQEKIIEGAVDQIFEVPATERRLSDVTMLLRGRERAGHDDLASRFEVWLNARGWLFNNPVDSWSVGNGIFGFDMTKILDDDDLRTAALGYIFHRIEGAMDGNPMMLFIDEGWKILRDQKFSAFLNDKLKTIRKLNGIVGFGTQSAKDIVSADIAHTLLEQTPTNLFFPNPKADEESYVGGFKLWYREFEWVRKTAPEARQFLIKHDLDSVIARLDLSHMLDLVKVLSGNTESVAECAALRAQYGDDPAAWLPHFCGWKVGK
ncbi:VirB4 family type IV secretion/conjugal transfer ATPase [Microvirga tunisiensis]|uniref:VirB4 family type IV secretion/conjugal transfer ATPase n=1 Tax=Microvirga tunisiensis TaxID=2108360 RepID=A0A5N7MIN1_9HYPH|nr:VirB4 family type IV secretion/conjugal transfer ATPase [Microvirga tunisiensis]MPR08656.1 VirB4 family type IV secretion/conjugal transfer ATPase [Microvirga tunisiensis]MPR26931.1 VirB4 family type IV secretion/conjugal transfer ATPase [Microvirga tunisiensis]